MTPAKYRDRLPQLSQNFFITDGGIETTLIYREKIELPSFASFVLLKDQAGRQALQKYFASYAELAKKFEVGIVLETPTWRANPDWGRKIGYAAIDLQDVNRQAVHLLQAIRSDHETDKSPVVISGCIGPRGDGYNPDKLMSAEDAEAYHEPQIQSFAEAGADLVSAMTLNYVEEAVGIVWAARTAGLPVVISFTVETNGRLPTGYTLEEAIEEVDESTDNGAAYYMVNCAHPTHVQNALEINAPWTRRLRGVRVNASKQSHAELDRATALDDGNPSDLAAESANLKSQWPQLAIFGGCCGTDERHIEEICKSLAPISFPNGL